MASRLGISANTNIRMMDNSLFADEVRTIQASMIEPGESHLSPSEIDDLRCLIRLTVEFSHHLENGDLSSPDRDEVRYLCDSVFSGVDSFCLFGSACRAMAGRSLTEPWSRIDMVSLMGNFSSKYREFLSETSFTTRCGLLLDLFKLQIVFAGMLYD